MSEKDMNEKVASVMKQKILIASDIRLENFELIVGLFPSHKKDLQSMKSEFNVCYSYSAWNLTFLELAFNETLWVLGYEILNPENPDPSSITERIYSQDWPCKLMKLLQSV